MENQYDQNRSGNNHTTNNTANKNGAGYPIESVLKSVYDKLLKDYEQITQFYNNCDAEYDTRLAHYNSIPVSNRTEIVEEYRYLEIFNKNIDKLSSKISELRESINKLEVILQKMKDLEVSPIREKKGKTGNMVRNQTFKIGKLLSGVVRATSIEGKQLHYFEIKEPFNIKFSYENREMTMLEIDVDGAQHYKKNRQLCYRKNVVDKSDGSEETLYTRDPNGDVMTYSYEGFGYESGTEEHRPSYNTSGGRVGKYDYKKVRQPNITTGNYPMSETTSWEITYKDSMGKDSVYKVEVKYSGSGDLVRTDSINGEKIIEGHMDSGDGKCELMYYENGQIKNTENYFDDFSGDWRKVDEYPNIDWYSRRFERSEDHIVKDRSELMFRSLETDWSEDLLPQELIEVIRSSKKARGRLSTIKAEEHLAGWEYLDDEFWMNF